MNIPRFFSEIQAAPTKARLVYLRNELYRIVGNGELDHDIAERLEEASYAREAELLGPRRSSDALSEARGDGHAELVAAFRPRSKFPPRRHIASPAERNPGSAGAGTACRALCPTRWPNGIPKHSGRLLM